MYWYILIAILSSQVAAFIDAIRLQNHDPNKRFNHRPMWIARMVVIILGVTLTAWSAYFQGFIWPNWLFGLLAIIGGVSINSTGFRITLNKLRKQDWDFVGTTAIYDRVLQSLAKGQPQRLPSDNGLTFALIGMAGVVGKVIPIGEPGYFGTAFEVLITGAICIATWAVLG